MRQPLYRSAIGSAPIFGIAQAIARTRGGAVAFTVRVLAGGGRNRVVHQRRVEAANAFLHTLQPVRGGNVHLVLAMAHVLADFAFDQCGEEMLALGAVGQHDMGVEGELAIEGEDLREFGTDAIGEAIGHRLTV